MFKKIKKKLENTISNLESTITDYTNNNPMKKFVDMALDDGILTDKERELLFAKAKSLDIDEIEFELYLENELEKTKKKNLTKIVALIEKLNIDGKISNEDEEIIYRKAKLWHLDEDEVLLKIKSISKTSKNDIEKVNEKGDIQLLITNVNIELNSIRAKRNRRQLRVKNELKKYETEIVNLNKDRITKDLAGWWKNLEKTDKERIRKKADVSRSFFKYSENDLIEMYFKENCEELQKEKIASLKKYDEEIEKVETLRIETENNELKVLLERLHNIPEDLSKEFKVDKLIIEIEKDIINNTKVLTGNSASEMISASIKGLENLLSNKEAMKTVGKGISFASRFIGI